MSSLDKYGGACRCLLRIRENRGNAWLSDENFINQHLDAYPQWKERPGELRGSMLGDLAAELGLALWVSDHGDYNEVLRQHQSGKDILVVLRGHPESPDTGTEASTMLLERMQADSFTLWCPYQSGLSGLLAPMPRHNWELSRATALVLQTTPRESPLE